MSDVILFRPKFLDYPVESLPIPWSLLYVGSSLTEQGYSVRIIDEIFEPDWQNVILAELENKPRLIGVTSMTGKQIKYGLRFSAFVKAHSSIPVVWGGVHPSLFPEQTLINENIDCIILDEGEKTIQELMQHLEGKQPVELIKGLGFKAKDKIFITETRPCLNMENLPNLHYSLIDIERYIGKRFGSQRSFELCTSRGCPHRCKFCYNQAVSRNSWRSFGVNKIINDLKELSEKLKIDGITWREDNFFVNRQRVQDIAERIIKEKINIKWHADCRIDYIDKYDDSFISLLKKSGCHTLTLGVESGSNKILQSINKDITVAQVLRVKDKLSRHGIYQNYHFMLGIPNESENDIKDTISLIHSLMRKNKYFGEISGPSLYTPYPGTALFEESVNLGFDPPTTLEGWIDQDWHSMHLPWFIGRRRKILEDTAWNIMGMSQGFVSKYFKFKFYLLARFGLHIPCFERRVYILLKKLQYIILKK